MLENPTPAAQPDSTAVIKRYAPPNQRQALCAFIFYFICYMTSNQK